MRRTSVSVPTALEAIGNATTRVRVAISAPPPWDLVRPLVAGSLVAHGWRLVDLGPVRDGSCVVTLANARRRSRRVHLCRNDGDPQGIVYTRRLDLVVMNEGHGDLPTEERLAQAVAQLAHAVAANEARVPRSFFAGYSRAYFVSPSASIDFSRARSRCTTSSTV